MSQKIILNLMWLALIGWEVAHVCLYQMSFLICQRHGKWEKAESKVAVNGYICMNRYCPESFRVFCSACKNDHRDHSIKVLTIEDVGFLVERLLKAPFRQAGRVVGESLDIMKKLKLIKEFRKKIDILEKEVQREALHLVDQTDALVKQYALSREGVTRLSELLSGFEKPQAYKTFLESSGELLANLDYNFKKDKFELGSAAIKESEERRRKSAERAKRKIEQVRDYSMKIIEVILHNDDTEDEEEDLAYQNKHYDMLKSELSLEKNHKELEEEISELKSSSVGRSRMRRETAEIHVQTTDEVLTIIESEQRLAIKLQEVREAFSKEEEDLKSKIKAANQDIQNLKAEMSKQKERFQSKTKEYLRIQGLLRKNRATRVQKQQLREEIIGRIIQFSQAKSATIDEKD